MLGCDFGSVNGSGSGEPPLGWFVVGQSRSHLEIVPADESGELPGGQWPVTLAGPLTFEECYTFMVAEKCR